MNSLAGTYQGMIVYVDPNMVQSVRSIITVKKTFYQRWIYPLFHGITIPFEPWVKFQDEEIIQFFPSKDIIKMRGVLIMHPAIFAKLMKQVNNGNN